MPIARVLLATSLVLALGGCGSGTPVEIPAPPAKDALGLSPSENESFSPIEFDKLVNALELAGDDEVAVETVIRRVNHKTVAWSGVVKGHRLVKNGPETSEFSLAVAPPSQADKLIPTTFPVLFEVANDDPVASYQAGQPIVFVGRLEFDGRTRDPWVLDSRRLETP